MATSLSLENDSSLAQGYLKVNGSTAATLTTSGITGNLTGNLTGNVTGNLTGNVTGSLTAGGSITLATAQTASGTAVDFTGIPSWVKRITVMFEGVSLAANDDIIVQIGDSGGIESSGYTSGSQSLVNSTIGYILRYGLGTRTLNGIMGISNLTLNTWVSTHSGNIGLGSDIYGAGSKSLSSTLDRIRITSVIGTTAFDAGTINISYEG
jgi:hypothetical protein